MTVCVRERKRETEREGMRERRRAEERSDRVRCSVMSAWDPGIESTESQALGHQGIPSVGCL